MNIMETSDLIIKQKVGYFGVEIYNFNITNDDHKAMLQKLLDDYLEIGRAHV